MGEGRDYTEQHMCVTDIYECAIHIRLTFSVTCQRDGGVHGPGHTYALFERCGSVLGAIKLDN